MFRYETSLVMLIKKVRTSQSGLYKSQIKKITA